MPLKKTQTKKGKSGNTGVKKTVKKTSAKTTAAAKKTLKKTSAAAAKKTVLVGTTLLKGKNAELVKKYQRNKQDTGSTEVQIALFTAKINQLSKHLKKHGNDSDSKRGLIIMVNKRRRLLNYLHKTDVKTYDKLISDLKLRK